MPTGDFKVLTRFIEITSLPLIFRYVFSITFPSNKVFYFSQVFIACHLSKIYLHSEKKRGFICPKTVDFLFQKHSNFYPEKIGVPCK